MAASEATSSQNSLRSNADAAAYLGLGASTLEKLRMTGKGPVYLKIGRRCLYAQHDLDAWLAQHRRISTTRAA
ncbi:MAG: helix-turn-helix domain-containing protein [Beijerinckiaceae bacterium]|jgi:predicted DNA-binding transcriptional regulator AlpA|nr:helix-turn-helix domain-containing protein [Beijerinckiaceae bacterium]